MTIQTFDIPQEILESARLTLPELKVEVAILLYASQRLSVGKARELAGMPLWQFRHLLASRQISAHYDTDDLIDDVHTLESLDHL